MNFRTLPALSFILFMSGCAEYSYSLKSPEAPQGSGNLTAHVPVDRGPSPPEPSIQPSPTPKLKSGITPEKTPVKEETQEGELWVKISESDGVTTYRGKREVGGVVTFMGDAIIDAPLVNVATVLNDVSLRKKWVADLKETHVIEAKSKLEKIEYNRMGVPWPFQDRDFVYQVRVAVSQVPSGLTIDMNSIEDPREPIHEGAVRGRILHARYKMTESVGSERKTRVSVEMAVNPGGAIPAWLVNLTQRQWPHDTLLSLKQMASRKDLVVLKEIQDYFIH